MTLQNFSKSAKIIPNPANYCWNIWFFDDFTERNNDFQTEDWFSFAKSCAKLFIIPVYNFQVSMQIDLDRCLVMRLWMFHQNFRLLNLCVAHKDTRIVYHCYAKNFNIVRTRQHHHLFSHLHTLYRHVSTLLFHSISIFKCTFNLNSDVCDLPTKYCCLIQW